MNRFRSTDRLDPEATRVIRFSRASQASRVSQAAALVIDRPEDYEDEPDQPTGIREITLVDYMPPVPPPDASDFDASDSDDFGPNSPYDHEDKLAIDVLAKVNARLESLTPKAGERAAIQMFFRDDPIGPNAFETPEYTGDRQCSSDETIGKDPLAGIRKIVRTRPVLAGLILGSLIGCIGARAIYALQTDPDIEIVQSVSAAEHSARLAVRAEPIVEPIVEPLR